MADVRRTLTALLRSCNNRGPKVAAIKKHAGQGMEALQQPKNRALIGQKKAHGITVHDDRPLANSPECRLLAIECRSSAFATCPKK